MADDNHFNESGGGDRATCDCTDLRGACEGIGEGRTDRVDYVSGGRTLSRPGSAVMMAPA